MGRLYNNSSKKEIKSGNRLRPDWIKGADTNKIPEKAETKKTGIIDNIKNLFSRISSSPYSSPYGVAKQTIKSLNKKTKDSNIPIQSKNTNLDIKTLITPQTQVKKWTGAPQPSTLPDIPKVLGGYAGRTLFRLFGGETVNAPADELSPEKIEQLKTEKRLVYPRMAGAAFDVATIFGGSGTVKKGVTKTADISLQELKNMASKKGAKDLAKKFTVNTLKEVPKMATYGAGMGVTGALNEQDPTAKSVAKGAGAGALYSIPFSLIGGIHKTGMTPTITSVEEMAGRKVTITPDDIMAFKRGKTTKLQNEILGSVPNGVKIQASKNTIEYTIPGSTRVTTGPTKYGNYFGQKPEEYNFNGQSSDARIIPTAPKRLTQPNEKPTQQVKNPTQPIVEANKHIVPSNEAYKPKKLSDKKVFGNEIIETQDSYGDKSFQLKGKNKTSLPTLPNKPNISLSKLEPNATVEIKPTEYGDNMIGFDVGNRIINQKYYDRIIREYPNATFFHDPNVISSKIIIKNGNDIVGVVMPFRPETRITNPQLINKPTGAGNLSEEARKYKSADEFVKAQGTRTGVEVRDKIGTKLQDPYTAEYLPTNSDGTITLYHSTTKEGAEKIKQSGIFGSKTEGGDIYFTTNKKGYGGIGKDKDVVLAFNVDPKKIKFDDVYRGELHLKGNNTDIGGIKPVEIKTKSQPTGAGNVGGVDALTAEAQKYKSADDFIKAQESMYHGSPVPLKQFSNKKGGVYFTNSMEDASGFAGNPDNVYEGYVKFKKPLVIDAKGAKWNELDNKYGTSTQEIIGNAQKDGYDGIVFKNIVDNQMDTAGIGGETTISYAYKPQDSFLNESQLKEIWKKSQVSTPNVGGDVKPEEEPNSDISKDDIRGEIAKTPEELKVMIEDTKKISKGFGVNVFEDSHSSKFAGLYEHLSRKYKFGRIKINQGQKDVIRAEVIAHEVGHAIDSYITGKGTAGKTSGKLDMLFNVTKEESRKINNELWEVTRNLVGDDVIRDNLSYYRNSKELWARFMQSVMFHADMVQETAPKAFSKFLELVETNKVVADFYKVAKEGMLEKPLKWFFLPDAKQSYEKAVGRYLGTKAWGEEILYRARRQKALEDTSNLIKEKFKGVKDSSELLFDVAEGIKVTKNGKPEFGTKIFKELDSEMSDEMLEKESDALLMSGYEFVGETKDGNYLYEKWRHSPEEAKINYELLSPEGKKLINEYTSDIEEAKDLFSREMLKTTYKIKSDIEGWVHHFGFDENKVTFWKRPFLKEKKAGARNIRGEAEGYIKDFRKAIEKAMSDLALEKEWNKFANKQIAIVAEPIAKGEKIKNGYVEIAGNILSGFKPIQDARMVVVQDEKTISTLLGKRYQVPKVFYDRYIKTIQFGDEAGAVAKVFGALNRYWQGNILIHAGSASTNMISGGLQYGGKVITDFYKDLLYGNLTMPRTRSDIMAMLETLTPEGWKNAPSYLYGGNKSNFYQQFVDQPSLDTATDKFIDKGLTAYQAIENFWKKAIVNSEKRIQKPVNLEDEEFIKSLNDIIDVYAFDYQDIPLWLDSWKKNPVGSTLKPFMTYPYKYAKMISNMAGGVFDVNLPWQDRMAKVMALGTIITAYGLYKKARNKASESDNIPEGVSPDVDTSNLKSIVNSKGRLFIGKDSKGNEIYVRTTKYPFFNLYDLVDAYTKKNTQAFDDVLTDYVGSLAPIARSVLARFGYKSEYDKYKETEVIDAEGLASYIPLGRMIKGIADYLDPSQNVRSYPKNFKEVFGQYLPTTNLELKNNVSPEEQIIKLPLSGNIKKGSRITEDVKIPKYKSDILWRELGGIVIKRINPDWYKRFIKRIDENAKKKTSVNVEKNNNIELLSKLKSRIG